jgi:hypothetical protein
MAQTKADKLLSRIVNLHRSLQEDTDGDGPSSLERDLMLGYLRELYEVYTEQQEETAPAPPPAARIVEREPSSPERPAPAPRAQPQRNESVPPPVVAAPIPPPPAPSLTAHTAHVRPAESLDPEIAELFEQETNAGMPSRLMRQRTTDLTRALSINNRVLFTNKLFGGNNEELNRQLKELNLKGSMANARPQLIELARQHGWQQADRKEVAREFIDLVRRRYA